MDEDDGGEYPDDVLAALAAPEQKPPKLPTLKEYKKNWDRLYALHARSPKGNFSEKNLSPNVVPQLWQNCPWVPFDILTADTASDEAHARLSRCFFVVAPTLLAFRVFAGQSCIFAHLGASPCLGFSPLVCTTEWSGTPTAKGRWRSVAERRCRWLRPSVRRERSKGGGLKIQTRC